MPYLIFTLTVVSQVPYRVPRYTQPNKPKKKKGKEKIFCGISALGHCGYLIFYVLMQSTAEIMWQDREQPLVFLDSLKEAHLYFLEGMKNGVPSCLFTCSHCSSSH